MKIKYLVITLTFLSLCLYSHTAAIAEDTSSACTQLDKKATGDMTKYSLYGEANGPVFFSGINCAIKHRNKEFCAMEMVSFDSSAKVYDYHTGEEIDISKAYFWLNENNYSAPILAFGSKEDAEMYGTATGEGMVLDYTGLTDREFK